MLTRILSGCLVATCFAFGGATLQLGSPASLMERFRAAQAGKLASLSLPIPTAGQVYLEIRDFHDRDGYLTLHGSVSNSPGSDFVFKGTEADFYGQVVLRDRNQAFIYSRHPLAGMQAEEVPVGDIYPDCDPPGEPEAGSPPEPDAGDLSRLKGPEPHIGPYDGSDIRKLQSLPGASKVIWLNMRRIMNGTVPIGWTRAEIWEFWQGTAAGFSMYKVNVTTDSAVWAAAGVANAGIANLYDETGRSSCGVNRFGTTSGCTVYRKTDALYNAGTLVHELGHLVGLSHDGYPAGIYFPGYSSFQWVPIMGRHISGLRWSNLLWQWSKGEYRTANQLQDDLAIINRNLPYRDDDHPVAVPLKLTGDSVPPLLNRGQIARNTDADTFSFEVARGGGRAKLRIDRTEFMGGSMLDVEALILDPTGSQVALHNAAAARHASLDVPLFQGRHLLVVRGGAEGSALTGFTRYSSLGFYAIQGTVTGGVVSTGSGPGYAAIGVTGPSLDGRMRLDFPEGLKHVEITLAAISGEVVFSSRTPLPAVDLSRFPAGSYLLHIKGGATRITRAITRL